MRKQFTSLSVLIFVCGLFLVGIVNTNAYSLPHFGECEEFNIGHITSISPTLFDLNETITIEGVGFGDNRDLNDGTAEAVYLLSEDGNSWASISGSNGSIVSWSDNEIIIQTQTPIERDGHYYFDNGISGINFGYMFLRADDETGYGHNICGYPDIETTAWSLKDYCIEDTWECTEWDTCSSGGTQERSCSKTFDCLGVDVSFPETTQSCTPECTKDTWTCEEWDECSIDGEQTRNCTKTYDCPLVVTSSPATTQSCTPECTEDTWECGEWDDCSTNGTQTRSCTKTYDCPPIDTLSPEISQSCTPKPTITSISPDVIYTGTKVTINGYAFGFYGDWGYYCSLCKVKVNNKAISYISSYDWSNTSITFTIPSDATSGYITVIDKNGIEGDRFNFTLDPDPTSISPTIDSISPKAITPGDTITITGSNFGDSQGSSKIMIGGSTAYGSILSWANTEIQYRTSSYWDDESKSVGIKKCKSYSSCLEVVSGGYFYIQPEITSMDYTVGAVGTEVRIYGKYFKDNIKTGMEEAYYYINIYFNGVIAEWVKWESTYLNVIVPYSASDGYITIKVTHNQTSYELTATGPYFDVLEAISNDEYSAYQEYFKQINLPQAWAIAGNRRTITVAVIDDGVYHNHPELDTKMWTNTDEIIGNNKDDDRNGYVDDYYGWNFVDRSGEMTAKGTHGTQVAGIIGAETNNGEGMAGVNWNVKIMPVIIFDSWGRSVDFKEIGKAIRYAVDNGAEVINLSMGTMGVSGYTTEINDDIEYAYNKNVLIVSAAGNGDPVGGIGFDLEKIPQSPICNDNNKNMVIGVGAVDENNYMTAWTNRGKYVDIWAPGTFILSTAVPAYSTFYDFYDISDGTSFSAPIVTGVVSLLKATHPTITSQEAVNLLIQNSNTGIVDAYKTLNAYFVPSNKEVISESKESNSSNSTNNTNEVDSKKVTEQERILITKVDKNLSKRVSGKILLQVEKSGEAWYVYPDNQKKHYLGRPADAFSIMRGLGLGITNNDLNKIPKSDESFTGDYNMRKRLSGKILLQVEEHGEAWYIYPNDLKRYYMGRPSDAFELMRRLGLGITNSDLRKIDVGEIE